MDPNLLITSPRSPRASVSELQARREEYESYKAIKKTFKNIIKDMPLEENVKAITGLIEKDTICPFGKGLYFPFALHALKIKDTEPDKWEEWLKNTNGMVHAAIQEYNDQRKTMKNGLRVILTSLLCKLESTHASDKFKGKIEEMIFNLSPTKESNIDFESILKILQNDESVDISPPKEELVDSSPSKSPKSLRRQISKLIKNHKREQSFEKRAS